LTILVVVMREPEAARLVHWAALVARARRDEAVEVLAVSRADETDETEVPLDESPDLTGIAAAALDAIRKAEGFLADLPDTQAKEDEEPFRISFALTAIAGPDPASSILARARKSGHALLLLGLGEKPKGEQVETDPVPEVFRRSPCRTLLLRAGGDEKEDAARILVPVSRGVNSSEALKLAVDLAGTAGGSVTALHVETRVGDDAELFGEKVLGRRVKRILEGSADVVSAKVVLGGSVREGVAEEAPGYDLVLVGTEDEWTGRRFLFGTVPDRLLTGPEGASVAVLRRGVPLTTRMQRAFKRLLD
jgi:nucleotide-binding universal stress UspA family protein